MTTREIIMTLGATAAILTTCMQMYIVWRLYKKDHTRSDPKTL